MREAWWVLKSNRWSQVKTNLCYALDYCQCFRWVAKCFAEIRNDDVFSPMFILFSTAGFCYNTRFLVVSVQHRCCIYGARQFAMAAIFLGSVVTPYSFTARSKYWTSFCKRAHLESFHWNAYRHLSVATWQIETAELPTSFQTIKTSVDSW